MLVGPTTKTKEVKDRLSACGIDARLIAPGVEAEKLASFCCEIRPRVVVLYCQNISDYGASIAKELRRKFSKEIAIFGFFDAHGDIDEGTAKMESLGVDTFISCAMPAAKVAEVIIDRWYGDMKKTAKAPVPAPAKPAPPTPPTRQAPAPSKAPPVQKVSKGILHNPPLPPQPIVWNIVGKHDQVLFIDPRRVRPLPNQPRKGNSPGFSKGSIAELGRSMKENGQMESATVCPIVGDPHYDAQLIDGERRQRGSLSAGIMLRVAVREDVAPEDVEDLYLLSVIGNTSKEPPTMSEYIRIVLRLRGPEYNFTLGRVANILGCHLSWVGQLEALGKLEPSVQALLEADQSKQGKKGRRGGKITVQTALQLVDLDPARQCELVQHILKEKLNYGQTKRHVLQVRRELGLLRTASGRVRRTERLKALGTLTERNIDAYGVYSDMSPAEWEILVKGLPLEERGAVCKDLRTLAASLNELADRVDEV